MKLLLCLVMLATLAEVAASQEKKRPLPSEAEIAAMGRIRAEYGCMAEGLESPTFLERPLDKPPFPLRDGIPAFRFALAPHTRELPEIHVPFGVIIQDGATDELVKALQHWKNLTRLSLDHDHRVTDAALRELKACTSLEELSLSNAGGITPVVFRELSEMKGLRTLYISHTQFDDTWARAAARCQNLTALYVRRSAITDEGAKALAAMKKLQRLDVTYSQITDVGLKELAKLPELAMLRIEGKVTRAGLKHLQGCKALRELQLGLPGDGATLAALREAGQVHCLPAFWSKPLEGPATDEAITYFLAANVGIDNASLKEIAHLPNLSVVRLGYVKTITNAGLMELTACKKLQVLEVFGTKVTADGVKAFRAALPGCKIYSDFDAPRPSPRQILADRPAKLVEQRHAENDSTAGHQALAIWR